MYIIREGCILLERGVYYERGVYIIREGCVILERGIREVCCQKGNVLEMLIRGNINRVFRCCVVQIMRGEKRDRIITVLYDILSKCSCSTTFRFTLYCIYSS